MVAEALAGQTGAELAAEATQLGVGAIHLSSGASGAAAAAGGEVVSVAQQLQLVTHSAVTPIGLHVDGGVAVLALLLGAALLRMSRCGSTRPLGCPHLSPSSPHAPCSCMLRSVRVYTASYRTDPYPPPPIPWPRSKKLTKVWLPGVDDLKLSALLQRGQAELARGLHGVDTAGGSNREGRPTKHHLIDPVRGERAGHCLVRPSFAALLYSSYPRG